MYYHSDYCIDYSFQYLPAQSFLLMFIICVRKHPFTRDLLSIFYGYLLLLASHFTAQCLKMTIFMLLTILWVRN